MIKVGILELGISIENKDDFKVIEGTIELAKLCDSLNYSRFWIGEHHEFEVAWRSPEILIPILAGYTEKIKIGAAGMLLALNSPLRISQNFKMLETLFPGRIDLGIARGRTSDFIAKELLNGLDYINLQKNHLERTSHIIKYLENNYTSINDKEGEVILTPPYEGSIPDVWMLGSSGATTDFAISKKLHFSMSLMHVSSEDYKKSQDSFIAFLDAFEKKNKIKPTANIALSVICESDKEKREHLINQYGRKFTINVIGWDEKECFEEINKICKKFKTDEVVLYFITKNFEDKQLIIENMARLFKL